MKDLLSAATNGNSDTIFHTLVLSDRIDMVKVMMPLLNNSMRAPLLTHLNGSGISCMEAAESDVMLNYLWWVWSLPSDSYLCNGPPTILLLHSSDCTVQEDKAKAFLSALQAFQLNVLINNDRTEDCVV